MPVQVNGKVRARLTVPAETAEDELRERALADAPLRAHGRQDRSERSWWPRGRWSAWWSVSAAPTKDTMDTKDSR